MMLWLLNLPIQRTQAVDYEIYTVTLVSAEA